MDRLFDRLSSLIRSLMQDQESTTYRPSRSGDPDLDQAMDELDEFLKTGQDAEPEEPPRQSQARSRPRGEVPEDIVQAYRNLELTPSATMEQVRESYRRLMRTYHPDKHTDDAEKQRIATEITQKITESFMKIRDFRKAKA